MLNKYYAYKITYTTKQYKKYTQIINYLDSIKTLLIDSSYHKTDNYYILCYITTTRQIVDKTLTITQI